MKASCLRQLYSWCLLRTFPVAFVRNREEQLTHLYALE
jgi:hypothetical protein